MKPSQKYDIFQLKITIKDIKPPIWRRILIRNIETFKVLQDVIHTFFNWGNYHLHEFSYTRGKLYRENYLIKKSSDNEDLPFDSGHFHFSEEDVRLLDVFSEKNRRAMYTYDFGDFWEHNLFLEKVIPGNINSDIHLPLCIKGKRATPLEDCGGPHGYTNILQYLKDPNSVDEYDREELSEWVEEEFEPEQIDCNITHVSIDSEGKITLK